MSTKKIALIVAGAALALSLIVGMSLYSFVNTTRNDGIALEQTLSAQYSDNQNELSTFISKFYETMGIANRKSAILDTILTKAVSGRYGEQGFKANGAFFASVKEAYPDLTSNLNVFDKIVDNVSAGREAFKGKQSKLLDEARVYQTWLNSGILRHVVVQNLGFPSDNLQARVGGVTVAKGRAALDKIEQIVVTGSTVDAFTTGKMEPLKP